MVIRRVGTQYWLIRIGRIRKKLKQESESDDEACPGDGDQESGDVSERE